MDAILFGADESQLPVGRYIWKKGQMRGVKGYVKNRRFLLQHQDGISTLIKLGVKAAHIASRYYCLQGEEYAAQKYIAREYGYEGRQSNQTVSYQIMGVLIYLGGATQASMRSKGFANMIARHVEGSRKKEIEDAYPQRIMDRFSLSQLPSKLSRERLKMFESFMEYIGDHTHHFPFWYFRIAFPEECEIVMRRLGIGYERCESLRMIAKRFNCSYETIRTIEKRAAKRCGITL